MKYSSLVFFLLLHACQLPAQQIDNLFSSPLNIPLVLSGNFCEVRTDHFHSGIDIKTDGREGLPVFAVADGYIYRIKVSATGYGKVLYIKHKGEIATVYAHLSAFTGFVADSVKSFQYSKQTFELEFYPDSTIFPVTKGMQIAWSGNSGGSEAPHLHFEIRDQLKEEPLNPLLHGWTIVDTLSPVISGIRLYEYSDGYFDSSFTGPILPYDTIAVNSDTITLGIQASDFMNDTAASELGIYSAYVSSTVDTFYRFDFNRMNFDQTRYVNAHIDYGSKSVGKTVQRCFTLPGNRSDIFSGSGSGLIPVSIEKVSSLTVSVSDVNGNKSVINFFVRRNKNEMKTAKQSLLQYPNKEMKKSWTDCGIEIKPGTFYETIDKFEITRLKRSKLKGEPTIKVGDLGIISHLPFHIWFEIPKRWSEMEDKLVVGVLNKKNELYHSLNTVVKGSKATAFSRKPGVFVLSVDTISPEIIPIGFETDSLTGRSLFVLKIRDDLSGIKNYKCKVDDQWHLFEYDAKYDHLIADAKNLPALFVIDIEVEDFCKNVTLKRLNVTKPQLE